MAVSYTNLRITCRDMKQKERALEILSGVTPFDEFGKTLFYMPLKSEDEITASELLEDLLSLLEEYAEKWIAVRELGCKLEIMVCSPLSCNRKDFPPRAVDFSKQIGAKILCFEVEGKCGAHEPIETGAAYCNLCGKVLDDFDLQENIAMDRVVGFGSKYDLSRLKFRLCLDCFDRAIDYLAAECVIPLKNYEVQLHWDRKTQT